MTQQLLSWDAHAGSWQPIANEQPIPARRAQVACDVPVEVTARVEWATDGVQLVETVVWAWSGRTVLVELHDTRRQTIGVWLPAGDVRRRRGADASPGPRHGATSGVAV